MAAYQQELNKTLSDKDTEKEKYHSLILASVADEESMNSSTTAQLIKKYNMSSTMQKKQAKIYLAQEAIESMLSEFKKNGEIQKKGDVYYYGRFEYNSTTIRELIRDNKKNEIKSIADKYFENIKLEFKKQANNDKINFNNKERQVIATNIASLKTQLKEADDLEIKKTELYLDSLYKKNKALGDARDEKARREHEKSVEKYNQSALSASDQALEESYKRQQLELEKLRQQLEDAKQRGDQHIDDLSERYTSAIERLRAHDERQAQQKAEHDAAMALQRRIAEINADNIRKQIEAANKNAKDIIDSQTEGHKAVMEGLAALGADISKTAKGVAQLGKTMGTIADTINKPPPKAPGLPPGCTSSRLPYGCGGDHWVMVPRFTQAINRSTGQTNIEIYQCNARGHYCSSDGQQGNWSDKDLGLNYYNITGWESM